MPETTMLSFTVYCLRRFGPLGKYQDWRFRMTPVGAVDADDELDALRIAKLRGFIAPIVAPAQT